MKNKKALVCGSSKGIGATTAIELSKLGTSVVLLSRNENALKKVLNKLDVKQGQKHDYLIADFDNPEVLSNKIKGYLKNNSSVDILINNSGGPKPGSIIDAKSKDFIDAFNRHLICNHICDEFN